MDAVLGTYGEHYQQGDHELISQLQDNMHEEINDYRSHYLTAYGDCQLGHQ
jgi:ubiquitin C-terminal hydrolase